MKLSTLPIIVSLILASGATEVLAQEDTCSGHSKSGDSSCADDLVCGTDNCPSGGDCCYQPAGLGTEEDPCEDVATTTGSRCVFPFTYKGSTFNTCASAETSASSHPKLWCATGVDAEGNYDGNWANCGECMSGRADIATTNGKKCVFPFTYGGVTYEDKCAVNPTKGYVWCSTETDRNGNYQRGKWGYCEEGSPVFTTPPPPTSEPCTHPWPETDPNCTTKGQTCIFPFTYKGVTYNDCATEDVGRRWCATKVDGNLKYIKGNWGYCPFECAVTTSTDCTEDKATYCSFGSSHTMCKYCGFNEEKCNGNVCYRGFPQDSKDAILDRHNELRRKVAKGEEIRGVNGTAQPGASNMYKLKWSDELERIAQRLADQCTWFHSDNDVTSTYSSWVGQNIWQIGGSYPRDGTGHLSGRWSYVDTWYNEVEHWPAGNVGSFTNSGRTGVTGHYTQVVWAKVKEVGCGTISFGKSPTSYQQIVVCNYGPGGNWNGQSVYNTNLTAPCPDGSVMDDGLCVW